MNAHPFADLALIVQRGNRTDREDAVLPIRATHPVFPFECRLRLDRAQPAFDGPCPVIGMQRAGPAEFLVFVAGLAGQRGPGPLFPHHPAIGGVGPQDAVDRVHGGAETVVAVAQPDFGLLAILDVDQDHVDAVDPTVARPARQAAHLEGPGAVAGQAHVRIDIDRFACKGAVQHVFGLGGLADAQDVADPLADHLVVGDAKHIQIALVGETEGQRAVEKAHQDRQGIGQVIKFGSAFGQGFARPDGFGDVQDGAQHAVHAAAVLVVDGGIEQVEDHVLGRAVAVQHHPLFPEGLHLSTKAAFQDPAVEIADFRPDPMHRAAQGARMVIARDLHVAVVVDHHMVRPPHQHLRNGRIDQRIDLDPQVLGPAVDLPQRGARPVETPYQFAADAATDGPRTGRQLCRHHAPSNPGQAPETRLGLRRLQDATMRQGDQSTKINRGGFSPPPVRT